MAHFEQDKTYEDMDGNIRQFKFRDYTKKSQVGFANTTGEKGEATKEYHKVLREFIDCFVEENPAIFAREIEEVIEIINDRIEWNREALFIAYRNWSDTWEGKHIKSVWSRVTNSTFKAIKEHIICKDDDCREKVEKWRKHYKKYKTL